MDSITPLVVPSGSLIAMPAYPSAPASIEPAYNRIAAAARSIFTGQIQISDFGPGPMEVSFSLPAMTQANGANWIAFLKALKGQVNYFQFGAVFLGSYPELDLGGRYWRLKTNQSKFPIGNDRVYRITIDAIEAIN